MIVIGLSPNTQKDDTIKALKTIFSPWIWKSGKDIDRVENWFKNYFHSPYVYSTNSGRSALYLILQSFEINSGDEIIVQAFSCLAVSEVVKWVNAKPVFVDIDETLNLDINKLEKSITTKTKAIIVQHTFGIPAQIETIKKIAQKYKLILIEDCAHSLGSKINNQNIGSFSDASFFSFGRDKVVSSVFGGLALLNKKYKNTPVFNRFNTIYNKFQIPQNFWIFQQLLHPFSCAIILPLYDIGVGKLILIILQKLSLLSWPIYKEEKKGIRPAVFPQRLPNGLASLLIHQLQKLDNLNTHRKEIAAIYFTELKNNKNVSLPPKIDGSIYLRFNILVEKPYEIRNKAKKNGIILGNWYHDIIDPENTRHLVNYKQGSCPGAENAAHHSLNLPTHIKVTAKDAFKIIKYIG